MGSATYTTTDEFTSDADGRENRTSWLFHGYPDITTLLTNGDATSQCKGYMCKTNSDALDYQLQGSGSAIYAGRYTLSTGTAAVYKYAGERIT